MEVKFLHQDQLVKLYDTDETFRSFYSNYFGEYISGIKNTKKERSNIVWEKHEYKKIKSHFWAVLSKYEDQYIGITMLLKVTDYGIFTNLPRSMFVRHWFIYGTYVTPQHRNKGVNKLMFNAIVEKVNPKGVVSIISNTNTPSIKSRESVGFKKIDLQSPYPGADWYLRSF
jgi:GNAT superfamily N-acetyltransferase